MIEEAYVSFEVAKLLKEKGFDEYCRYFYDCETPNTGYLSNKKYGESVHNSKVYDGRNLAACPTHQVAMAWLRKNHNICITIYPDKENGYEAVLYDIKNDVEIVLQSFGVYGIHIYKENYEEAIESALKYVLENLI